MNYFFFSFVHFQKSFVYLQVENEKLMTNYLISEAIGDIAGSAYEGRPQP